MAAGGNTYCMSSNNHGNQEYILALLAKFERGEASPQELAELDEWYSSFEGDGKYTTGLTPIQKALAREHLMNRINKQIYRESIPQKSGKLSRNYLWVSVALVILSFSIGIYTYRQYAATPSVKLVEKVDAQPGGNKAVLTLADGKKISLTDAKIGELVEEAGLKISKTADGQLLYETVKNDGAEAIPDAHNTIETPNGGQYRVTLPDGSKVWLNAASSLRYPASFIPLQERRVELSGEAYFEIVKDKNKPFLVVSGKQTVEVLGTHFNINAYGDEPNVKTTLLEGSIRLKKLDNGRSVLLIPGQQAVLEEKGVVVKKVPLDEAVAWKDGMFRFNNTDLQTIMRQMARWYNVEVAYEGNIDYKGFFGSIERNYTLTEVLEVLKLGNVNYRLELPATTGAKKRLIVLPLRGK